MIAIYKRELKSYFHSFLGPLFIGATLLLLGIYFAVYDLFMGYSYIGYALSSVVFLFLISFPILTMRILAEERHQKTDQLILTSPVSVSGIVIGKFLALATVFAVPVAIISVYPLILSLFGTVSFGESYLAILGFFLYGLACIAVGVFISSITESQVIAAVLTFGLLFLSYIMSGICNMISSTGNFLTRILSAFYMVGRFDDLLNGSLHLTSIVYYLSVIVLFLIFTVQSIQKRRYQVSAKNISMSAYSSTVVVISTALVVFLNILVSELPAKYTVFDLTANKLYSLTEETKTLVDALEEDVNIYVLVSEDQADTILDTTLKNYADLNSSIHVTYVDPAVNPKFFTQYTSSSVTYNSIIVEGEKRSKVIDYSDIYQSEIDYTTYSSTVTGYDGEGQITSAIAYVTTDDMPKIYILEGHGETAFDASFQSAIEKENIDYETINLVNYESVPADVQCVVINTPTADLSDDDTEKMLEYMNQGGDVLLIAGYTEVALPNFESLLGYYSVSVAQGYVIEEDTGYYYGRDPYFLLPDISYDSITESAYNSGSYVFVPQAQGLVVNESEDTEVTTLLSSSENSFVRNSFSVSTDYTRQEDDVAGPFALGVKCEKTVGEGEESSVAVIYSSQLMFTEAADAIVAGTNLKLFSGSLGTLVMHTDSVTIPVKSYEISYLVFSESNLIFLSLLTVIVIPFAFLIGGFVIWFRRRKR